MHAPELTKPDADSHPSYLCQHLNDLFVTFAWYAHVKHNDKLNVIKIDIDEEPAMANRFGIQGIPVIILFDKNGKQVFRNDGYMEQKGIQEQIDALK